MHADSALFYSRLSSQRQPTGDLRRESPIRHVAEIIDSAATAVKPITGA